MVARCRVVAGLHQLYADKACNYLQHQAQPAVAIAATHLAPVFEQSQLLSLAQISLSHIERAEAHGSKQASGAEEQARQQAPPEDAVDSCDVTLAMRLTDALLSVSSTMGQTGVRQMPQSQTRQAHVKMQASTGTASNPSIASGALLPGGESSASDKDQMQNSAWEGMSNKPNTAGILSIPDADQIHESAQQGDVQTRMWDAIISSLVNAALAGVHTADDLLVKAHRMTSNSSIAHGFNR